MKYDAKGTIYIENIGPFDKPGFSSMLKMNINGTATIDDFFVTFSTQKNSIMAAISSIEGEEEEVFEKVKSTFVKTCQLLGFQAQKMNNNSHYGHINYYFNSSEIILESNSPPAIIDAMHMEMSGDVSLEEFSRLEADSRKEAMAFLIPTFYNGLSRSDYKVKYFSQFLILEYLEKNYTKEIKTSPLISSIKYKLVEEKRLFTVSNG